MHTVEDAAPVVLDAVPLAHGVQALAPEPDE